MQNNEDLAQQSIEAQLPQIQPISWTATESIAQQRTGRWYGIATIIFVAITAVDVLLFIFKITSLITMVSSLGLFVAMYIALLISTKMPARESTYVLSGDGIAINGHQHGFNEFRAFGVRHRGSLWQLVLIPTKRFSMEVVSYIDEDHGEAIVDILASYLPMEEVPENSVDRLIDRLKM
ncbi:MAG: hypothetical protein Q4C83_00185 [Candidatus Saccharibacteria bacterium]|nr:hypothetical protein [Candidatus Saccharibacteria bacterium]